MLDALACLTSGFATVCLSAPAMPILLILIPPLFFMYWRARTISLKSSREIKRLEASSRSPLYALFNSTVHGISTILAFSKFDVPIHINASSMNRFFEETKEVFYNLQNENIRAALNFQAACRWLGHQIDFANGIYSGMLAIGIVMCFELDFFKMSPTLTGILLLYALTLSGKVAW